jgi:hypothetical protein
LNIDCQDINKMLEQLAPQGLAIWLFSNSIGSHFSALGPLTRPQSFFHLLMNWGRIEKILSILGLD